MDTMECVQELNVVTAMIEEIVRNIQSGCEELESDPDYENLDDRYQALTEMLTGQLEYIEEECEKLRGIADAVYDSVHYN